MTSPEIAAHHTAFELEQGANAVAAYKALGQLDGYCDSYSRLISFQGWMGYLFQGSFSSEVSSFYVEAQNDGLISHLLARQGMWRPSLQSLRSCLENMLACHYYLDHPVELILWGLGKHRMGFSELMSYFEIHPSFRDVADQNLTGLPLLKSEYSDLSKAVHGSSASFLMGDPETMPNVYLSEPRCLGQWLCRQKRTVEALNLFMLTFHREKLVGTNYPALRKAIAKAISVSNHAKIKAAFNVNLKAHR